MVFSELDLDGLIGFFRDLDVGFDFGLSLDLDSWFWFFLDWIFGFAFVDIGFAIGRLLKQRCDSDRTIHRFLASYPALFPLFLAAVKGKPLRMGIIQESPRISTMPPVLRTPTFGAFAMPVNRCCRPN